MADVGNGKSLKRPSSGNNPAAKKVDNKSSDESVDSDASNDCSPIEENEIDKQDIPEPLIKLPEVVFFSIHT